MQMSTKEIGNLLIHYWERLLKSFSLLIVTSVSRFLITLPSQPFTRREKATTLMETQTSKTSSGEALLSSELWVFSI
jgi:hypothetical protein